MLMQRDPQAANNISIITQVLKLWRQKTYTKWITILLGIITSIMNIKNKEIACKNTSRFKKVIDNKNNKRGKTFVLQKQE